MAWTRVIIIALLYLICSQSSSFAAAWTQNAGSGQAIQTLLLSNSDIKLNNGNIAQDKKLQTLQYNLFAELGITDKITVGVNSLLSNYTIENNNGKVLSQEKMIDYTEFTVRKRLINSKNFVFSNQVALNLSTIPLNTDKHYILRQKYQYEYRLLFGIGIDNGDNSFFSLYKGQRHFADFELAYRKENNQNYDQIRIDTTLGIRPSTYTLLLFQVFKTVNVYKDNQPYHNISSNFSINRDDISKLYLSASIQVSDATALQMGVFQDWSGTNKLNEKGIMFAIWHNFDSSTHEH